MIFLSIAYAANTGGTGSLTGTGSNLILKGVVAEFPGDTPINFANWMFYAVPAMLLNLLGCWLWLQYWFMGLENPFKKPVGTDKEAGNQRRNQNVRRVLKLKIQELGRVTFHEAAVFCLFVLLVLLWLFRDPKFITGWGNFVHVEWVWISKVCSSFHFWILGASYGLWLNTDFLSNMAATVMKNCSCSGCWFTLISVVRFHFTSENRGLFRWMVGTAPIRVIAHTPVRRTKKRPLMMPQRACWLSFCYLSFLPNPISGPLTDVSERTWEKTWRRANPLSTIDSHIVPANVCMIEPPCTQLVFENHLYSFLPIWMGFREQSPAILTLGRAFGMVCYSRPNAMGSGFASGWWIRLSQGHRCFWPFQMDGKSIRSIKLSRPTTHCAGDLYPHRHCHGSDLKCGHGLHFDASAKRFGKLTIFFSAPF